MTSILSSCLNTWFTGTCSSLLSGVLSSLSATVSQVTWISIKCAFFWQRGSRCIWVWAIIQMTWQYFFMPLKFFSCFLPMSSCPFLQGLLKTYFLNLCQFLQKHILLSSLMCSVNTVLKVSCDFTISHDVYSYCEWCFNNGYNLHNFLLFCFGFWSTNFPCDVSHASLAACKGGEVKRFGRVTLGKTLHFPTMLAAKFLRQEAQGFMPGSREFPVRLFAFTFCQ